MELVTTKFAFESTFVFQHFLESAKRNIEYLVDSSFVHKQVVFPSEGFSTFLTLYVLFYTDSIKIFENTV